MEITESIDFERRFGGTARLFGERGFARIRAARICVVGIGGVGSWAAEALARSAVGRVTLIDMDHIAESNTNRQIHALGDTYGRAKIEAMAERMRAIDPRIGIDLVDDYLSPENAEALLSQGFDAVLDCIDHVRSKVAIAACCLATKSPLVMCGASGGKTDPSRIVVEDIARAIQDPLLSGVRRILRKENGLPRDGRKMGLTVITSNEPLLRPAPDDAASGVDGPAPQGLSCAGYGSVVTVTATFGLMAAGHALRAVAKAR